jgi:hypothetical protein
VAAQAPMASTMPACTEGDKGNECIRGARISS